MQGMRGCTEFKKGGVTGNRVKKKKSTSGLQAFGYFEPTSSFGFISTFLSLSHIFWVSAACFSVVNFQARLKEMILLQDLKVELLEAAF